jgi:glycosyltransferase involved in cell wall biosynthesis
MASPLRILHVDPERGWGGGEEQVLALTRHLKGLEYRVSVAAHPEGALWRAAEAAGIEVHPLAVRNGFDVRAVRGLRKLITEMDVVHFHTARAHALALWLPRGPARRVVTRRMDYPPRPRAYVRILYNRRVDRVVAISRRIRDVLVGVGVAPERIRVIPSGVDVARFVDPEASRDTVRATEWGVGPADPVILVVGALVQRKGHAVLLEAAQLLHAAGLRACYAFCGEGECRGHLERQADRLGLGGAVHFMGWRGDVPRLLAGADVVAVPSLHEGLGVAALEAMAAGRPVVASRTGGLAEVVSQGETGWLVPSGDPRALAEAIDSAVRDPVRAQRYGTAGRARVSQEYGMERMVADNAALYRTLVGAAN